LFDLNNATTCCSNPQSICSAEGRLIDIALQVVGGEAKHTDRRETPSRPPGLDSEPPRT